MDKIITILADTKSNITENTHFYATIYNKNLDTEWIKIGEIVKDKMTQYMLFKTNIIRMILGSSLSYSYKEYTSYTVMGFSVNGKLCTVEAEVVDQADAIDNMVGYDYVFTATYDRYTGNWTIPLYELVPLLLLLTRGHNLVASKLYQTIVNLVAVLEW